MSKYIGGRIVPKHCGVWSVNTEYENLSIVYEPTTGDSYISKKAVPAGTELDNGDYWALSSVFSQQLSDMSNRLSSARDSLFRGISEMEQNSAALNTRLDSIISGAASDDVEIKDARVDADGGTHENIGSAIRSIVPRMEGYTGKAFHEKMASCYAKGLYRAEDEPLHKGAVVYPYSTSTFSGWVSEYTVGRDFLATSLSFYVKARDTAVTSIRTAIAVDARQESNAVFNSILSVDIPAGTEKEVTCPLPALFLEAGRKVYVLVEADQICSQGFGSGITSQATQTWYATDGKMTEMERCSTGTAYSLYAILSGYSPEGSLGASALEETGKLREELEEAERSISGEMEAADAENAKKVEEIRHQLLDSFRDNYEILAEKDLLPTQREYLYWKTSIFTGWGAPIGTPQHFNALVFKILNRETNGEDMGRIRCFVTEGDKEGKVLADVTRDGFSIKPGEQRTVVFLLDAYIENTAGAELYAGFSCDQYVTPLAGSTGKNLNPPDYGEVAYDTVPEGEDYYCSRHISKWSDIYDATQTNEIKPVLYAAEARAVYLLGDIHEEAVRGIAESVCLTKVEGRGILSEAKGYTDTLQEKINGSFNEMEVMENEQDLLPVSNPAIYYNTSTFTGWAAPVGAVQDFNTVVFEVINRATNTGDIDKIRVVISKESKSGDVIWDETQTGFGIKPGEQRKVEFRLSGTVVNEEGDMLYIGFACDQWIGVLAGDSGVNLNAPDYGNVCYLSIAGEAPFDTSRELGKWSPVYDQNLTNQRKALLYVKNYVRRYLLSERQLSQVANLAWDTLEIPAETLRAEISAIYPAPRVILPDRYQAVVGDTLQLFYRGIVEHPWPYFFNIEFNCDIGKNTARYFEVTPTEGQVGEHTLTVNIRDSADRIVATGSTVLEVGAVGVSPTKNASILCIGDSLTASGSWSAEAMRRLTGEGGSPAGGGITNVSFIGTKKNGDCGYEGYGGWTWASYLAAPSATTLGMWAYCTHDKDSTDQHSLWEDTNGCIWQMEGIEGTRLKFTRYNSHTGEMPAGSGVLKHYKNAAHTADIQFTATAYAEGNPFWDAEEGKVDFQSYCVRNGFSGIDYVYTLLTWNGGGGYSPEADSTIPAKHTADARKLIRLIHESYPEAKVKVMGIQLPSLDGGCGANYGAGGGYSNAYGLVRTVMGLNLAYQEMAGEDEFSDYVEFINVSGQFDSENNMAHSSKPVNTRSTSTELVGTNGVHPATAGYMQIADAAYRNMALRVTQRG